MKRNLADFSAIGLALVASLSLLALSCAEGPVGIFQSVAGETPVNANMTKAFETASPSWVAQVDFDGAGANPAYYYAGIGVLWRRAAGGAWAQVSLPSNVNGGKSTFAASGAVAGTTLYCIFVDTASKTSLGVWQTTDGSAWTETDSTFPDAATEGSLIRLLAANGQLFAITRESTTTDGVVDETHSVFYLSGTFAATSTSDADIGAPSSVAYDGSNYWMTAGTTMLSGSASGITAVAGPSTTEILSGIIDIGGGDFVVASRSGKLWLYNGSWTATSVFSNVKDKAYALTQPVYVPYSGGNAILAGAQAYPRSSTDIAPAGGYLEFAANPFVTASAVPDAGHSLTTDAINFDTSLAYQSVRAMVAFPETSVYAGGVRVFALVDGFGLWSNYWNGTSWSKWARE